MKKIIVATDFSESAANAVLYATDLAVALDADLVLLHVYLEPVPVSEIPVIADIEKDMQKAEDQLIELKNRLNKKVSRVIDIHYSIRRQPFFTALSGICEEVQPYMVILGSQGTTAIDRLILGSHTVYTMKHLQWPVLTVPKGASFQGILKVGLACDLHDVANLIPVEKLNKLLTDLKAELHILNIGKPGTYDPELVTGSETLFRLSGNIKPRFHFLTGNDTDAGIEEFADKIKINLLIILPREHGIIHKLLHRSHTKYFVLHSQVPVLALHQIEPKSSGKTVQESKIDINDIM